MYCSRTYIHIHRTRASIHGRQAVGQSSCRSNDALIGWRGQVHTSWWTVVQACRGGSSYAPLARMQDGAPTISIPLPCAQPLACGFRRKADVVPPFHAAVVLGSVASALLPVLPMHALLITPHDGADNQSDLQGLSLHQHKPCSRCGVGRAGGFTPVSSRGQRGLFCNLLA